MKKPSGVMWYDTEFKVGDLVTHKWFIENDRGGLDKEYDQLAIIVAVDYENNINSPICLATPAYRTPKWGRWSDLTLVARYENELE